MAGTHKGNARLMLKTPEVGPRPQGRAVPLTRLQEEALSHAWGAKGTGAPKGN